MIYGNRILHRNLEGNDVQELQQRLEQLNYIVPVDGKFSPPVEKAVKKFQQANGLKADGIVGPETFRALELAAFPPVNQAALQILVTLHNTRLHLLEGDKPVRSYYIAIGKASTPTPLGVYAIVEKIVNPGGVLGSRWLGLSKPGYGIHGTNDPSKIGTAVSNGCIRMHNWNVEIIFSLVREGTLVTIEP